jgi:hypothetical protein
MPNASVLKVVTLGLVLALIIELVGIVLIILNDKQVPGELWTLCVAEVTGLLGLLAPSKDAVQN